MYSCKKGDSGEITPIDPVVTIDTTGTLKSKASFPIGMAMRADIAGSVPAYFRTAVRESSWVTFENELKNDFVVQADGSYNFAVADAFYQKCVAAGLEVYGHTLVWHSQQRANVYNAQIQVQGQMRQRSLTPTSIKSKLSTVFCLHCKENPKIIKPTGILA